MELPDSKKCNAEKEPPQARIIIDPVTGLPALTAGKDAPILTSEQVEEMLADFP